ASRALFPYTTLFRSRLRRAAAFCARPRWHDPLSSLNCREAPSSSATSSMVPEVHGHLAQTTGGGRHPPGTDHRDEVARAPSDLFDACIFESSPGTFTRASEARIGSIAWIARSRDRKSTRLNSSHV